MSGLRLPRPHYPAARFLVCDDLGLPRFSQRVLEIRRKCRPYARLSGTTSVDRSTWADGSVEPCADTTTVEIFSAICHRWRPLADNCPQLMLIEINKRPCVGTHALDMLLVIEWYGLVSEHLINMRVHSDTSKSVRWHKVVPEAQRLECIMDDSEYVALLAGTKGEPNASIRV